MHACRQREERDWMDPLKGLFRAQVAAPCTLQQQQACHIAYSACFLTRLHLPQMTRTRWLAGWWLAR